MFLENPYKLLLQSNNNEIILIGSGEKLYTSHIIVSDHGVSLELLYSNNITITEIKPIYIECGWNSDNIFQLEKWLKETINHLSIFQANKIQINILGSWLQKIKTKSI